MNVYLRALEIDDAESIYRWRMDSEVTEMLSGATHFASRDKERRWVEEKMNSGPDQLYLAICLAENDRIIGYTSINNIDYRHRRAEWGGTLIGEKKYWAQGVAKTVALSMLKHVFEELGLNRCYAYCLADHEVTLRLFKSLHFQREGILRSHIFKRNAFHDCALYSILRDDYLTLIAS